MSDMPKKSCHTADHPPATPSVRDILATRSWVAGHLKKLRLSRWDIEDVMQEAALAAWSVVQRGGFRPDPKRHPEAALRSWVYGIAWRQAVMRVVRKPWRREVLDGEASFEIPGPDPLGQLEARAALLAMSDMPTHQVAMLATCVSNEVASYADAMGFNVSTTHRHLQRARMDLAKRIGRRM